MACGIATLLSVTFAAPDASAATLTVTTSVDIVADDGLCSLSEAITAANTDTASGALSGECTAGLGSDTILLPLATFTLSNTLPPVSSFISIIGSGSTIDGAGSRRIFTAQAGAKLDIDNVTLTGGLGTSGGAIDVVGGTVNLISSTVTANSASIFGGAIFNNGGSVNVVNSTLSGNSSGSEGGAIYNLGGTVTVIFSTITNNSATDFGAGIASTGDAATTTSIAASIVADNGGGANDLDLVAGATDSFDSGSYNVIGSSAGIGAFGAATDDLTGQSGVGLLPLATIAGGSTQTHALATGSPAFDHVTGPITFGFDQSADQNNTARPIGTAKEAGAVELVNPCASPLTVNDETSLDFAISCYNTTAAGTLEANLTADVVYTASVAEIDNPSAASLTINGAGFTLDADGNSSVLKVGGGQVDINNVTLTGGFASSGGGISHSGGTLTLNGSTVSGNSASVFGGAVTTLNGDMTIVNSTLSGNSAGEGGAIFNTGSTVTIVHSTISDNEAPTGSGIASTGDSSTTTQLAASIVADNRGDGDDLELVSGAVNSYESGSFNVIGSTSFVTGPFGSGTSDLTDQTNIALAPLAPNAGGLTETHLPTLTSPVFDHVTGALTLGVSQAVDQNGTSRPIGTAKEAGSVETANICESPISVADDTALSAAIDCYNALPAGSMVINITADITYATGIAQIDNPNFPQPTLTVNGAGFTLDSDSNGSVLWVSAGDVSIDNLTMTGGHHPTGGGAIRAIAPVTITNSTIVNNTGGLGGGIYNSSQMTITDSTITNNSASIVGGGVFNEGTLTIVNSTISENTSTNGGGGIYTEQMATIRGSTISGNTAGGGGGIEASGTASISNSTISGNTSTGPGGGMSTSGDTTISFTTISENTAPAASGIASRGAAFASTKVSASIVADNLGAGDDIELSFGTTDSLVSGSFNVLGSIAVDIGAFGGATGDLVGQSSLGLLPLALNAGGSTETHGLVSGSMAIGRVTGTVTAGIDQAADQNGTARPQGVGKDSGSVEAVGLARSVCNGELVTINLATNGGDGDGTNEPDVILGTVGSDNIHGRSGNDTICAGGGPDTVRGGSGNDTIFGEGGQDLIRAGGGEDTIEGGDGNDTILGQAGADTIDGGAGDDEIDGQGAADTISGGTGDDTINGQNGGDILRGNAGSDTIRGQAGPDEIRGDGGDDDLGGGNGADTLFGGPGIDKCAGNTGPDQAQAVTCETTPGVEVLF